AFEEFKRQARVFTAYENHRWHRDGWLVTLETSGRLVYQDGKMVGFRGVDRDVTARERARKRLQRAHQELARRVEDRTSELREINRRLSREIEQRRAAETALRQSEKRYRNLMENLPLDAFMLKNNPLRFVYLNFDRSRLLGYPAEDLLQWPEERIREKIHPDDREKVITRLDQRFRGERPGSETYECRLYAEDGAVHWVRLFVSRVTFQDEAAIQTVVVDVTQNKREKKRLNTSTHRLQQLLDAGDVGRAWIDEQMRVVNMNSTLRERAGWTEPETDPPCTSVLCRAAGHNLCGDECPVKKAFREETPQKAVDTIEAGDEISVLQVVAVPEEDEDGRMVQALVTTMRLSSDR
ncbi:MAG: PAS domain-containing protein, partial [Planctomycetota bacterium]